VPLTGASGPPVHFSTNAVYLPNHHLRDDLNVSDPMPYKEAFPVGTVVRVADRASLEGFMASWRYHHKLQPEQLGYVERAAMVEEVGFYHGGDPVHKLAGIPGLWLEQCLERAESGQVG
jgi:hypothetical protein